MSVSSSVDQSNAVRALVADQDFEVRKSLVTRLTGLACECEQAEDGVTAWHAIMSNSFDVAIIDLTMPNFDGIELIRCARAHPRTKHMPLVVMASQNDRATVEEALAAGATSFLSKPLNWAAFAAHLDYLLKLRKSVKESRATARRQEAIGRVKDAVLGTVLRDAKTDARVILDAISYIKAELENGSAADAVHEALQNIAQSAHDLQNIITKAGQISDMIPERLAVEDELVDVMKVLEDLHGTTSTTAAAHDVEMIFLGSVEHMMLRCDRGAIIEALTQIVVHAITQSRAGQAVKISCQTESDGQFVFVIGTDEAQSPASELEIHDDQLDSDEDDAESATQFQADAMEAIRQGKFGLGLPFAQAIAEAHGGSLDIQMNVDSSSITSLRLPAERMIMPEEFAA